MDQDEAKRLLWHKGKLRYLLRKQPSMQGAYDAFRADEARAKGRIHFWNVSRQFGKSYSCCVLALEECLRRPGAQVKYASVDAKMCRAIVFPQMEKLLADCPEELLPQFRSQDGVYYFPHNGSRLTIAGADKDNIKKLRGQQAHLGIVDEGGFMANLQKVVLDVLLPQTTTTGGRILVATTPPDSAGHYASELYNLCKSREASATFDIWENQLLSDSEKQEIVRDMGGQDSTQFRREYLCQFVTDAQNAVIPEFTQEAETEVVLDSPRPEYFDGFVSLDGGFSDPAGALFAYTDFKRAKLVIEEEWLEKGAITEDIAKQVGAVESRLWGKTPLFWPDSNKRQMVCNPQLTRVMDHDPAMAAEFMRNHGMAWKPAKKLGGDWDLMGRVNLLNQWIRSRFIEIHPRCKQLIRQLHNCTWAGRRLEDGMTARRTFSRNKVDGHFDLVAALLYLIPEVDLSHNPFPPDIKRLTSTWYPDGPPGTSHEADAEAEAAFSVPEIDS